MFWAIASLASQGLGMLSSYGSDMANYKASKKIQEYKNKMTNIAAAQKQNAITTNVTLAIQASARQAADQQVAKLQASATSEANAAAEGVKGNAVELTLTEVANRAGQAEHQRQVDMQTTFLQADTQRRAVQLDAKMNQDISRLPKPDLTSRLLGFGASAFTSIGKMVK